MTQAAGHTVSNHRVAHRLADDQPKAWSAYADQRTGRITMSSIYVHDSVIPVCEHVYD